MPSANAKDKAAEKEPQKSAFGSAPIDKATFGSQVNGAAMETDGPRGTKRPRDEPAEQEDAPMDEDDDEDVEMDVSDDDDD